MIREPNVLILDEPTNHLDLESIEALVGGLASYPGTLVFVSHDRWFVGALANRIVEISPAGIRDYHGSYAEYVRHCGDDHLDVEAVAGRARDAKREERRGTRGKRDEGVGDGSGGRIAGGDGPGRRSRPVGPNRWQRRQSQARAMELTERIEAAEMRISEIEDAFAAPSFYREADPEEVRRLESERQRLLEEIETLMQQWEKVEARIANDQEQLRTHSPR